MNNKLETIDIELLKACKSIKKGCQKLGKMGYYLSFMAGTPVVFRTGDEPTTDNAVLTFSGFRSDGGDW